MPLAIGFFVLLLPFFVLDREYFERTDIIVHTTPRVTRTYPDAPQTRVPPDTPVWIEFNKRMDISSVEDAILSYPHAVVQVSYYDSSRFLRIEPELGFHHHSRYVSTIPDSARDSQGRWLDRGVNGRTEVSSGSPSTPTHQGQSWTQNCLHLDARSVHDETLQQGGRKLNFVVFGAGTRPVGMGGVLVAMADDACSTDWGTANTATPAGPVPFRSKISDLRS